MASYCKFMYCAVTFVLLIAAIMTAASPERSKIRIHVPVKHHTHFHTRTKTIIKPVHIPIKTHHHVIEEEPILHNHHRISEDEEDDQLDDWAETYARKKKFHPFI